MEIKRLEATNSDLENLDERRNIEHDDLLTELEELRKQRGRDKEAQFIAQKEHDALSRKIEALQSRLKATQSKLSDTVQAKEKLKLLEDVNERSQHLKKQLQVAIHQMAYTIICTEVVNVQGVWSSITEVEYACYQQASRERHFILALKQCKLLTAFGLQYIVCNSFGSCLHSAYLTANCSLCP